MNKYLPDNIDDFFSGHLKNYSEEPEENIWNEIDKRLSENERRTLPRLAVLSLALVIAVCMICPLFVNDPSIRNFHPNDKNYLSEKANEHEISQPYSSAVITAQTNNIANAGKEGKSITQNDIILYVLRQNDFNIAEKLSFNRANELSMETKQQHTDGLYAMNFFKDSLLQKEKPNESKSEATIVKISKKHNFSINPFFSIDHVSGRFVEQYEFNHENENDYQHREKPDFSFTLGALAQYRINNKFSVLSGVSVSKAGVSISATAVSALKDRTGVYKFKLATSYGLIEISKSGITPVADDTLLVTGASLNLKYISFPALISYNIKAKKIKLSVHGGIAVNKIMSDRVEAEYNVQNNSEFEIIDKIEGIKRIFFTVNAGVEAGYPVSRNVDVSLSPEIRYGINSINKGTPVKTYPLNYGLALHLNVKL